MPATANYSLTGDPYVDGLLGEQKWAVTNLTYSTPSGASYYGSNYGAGEPDDRFEALNSDQKFVLDRAFEMFASVANVEFTKIADTNTEHADLRFAMSDLPSTAWGYFPSTAAEGGDVWFNNSSKWYDSPVKGNYSNLTFIHEIGHALGLEHPHHDNVMPLDRDSMEYTVMSYRSYVGGSLTGGYSNETWGYAQSLMMYDIAALQHLYGANYNTNSGNTLYSWSPQTGEMFINGEGQGAPGGNRIFSTVWDGGGVDTYDFSNYKTDLEVSLKPGDWTTTSSAQLAELHYDGSELATGNIANAMLFEGNKRSLIENAKGGSGNDEMTGNSACNALWGGGGNDNLRGEAGADVLYGGSGHDTLAGGYGRDRLVGQSGNDHLFGDGGPDRLIGGAGDDELYGGWGRDVFYGGKGNDVLVGGAGADLLVGNQGQDRFVFCAPSDSRPGAMDRIDDFVCGTDKIDLQQIDANLGLAGDQAFSFIGSGQLGQGAGLVNFRNEVVSADVDGDGTADLQFHVTGVAALSESDFIL